jgi:hypothetical protein
MAGGVLPMIMMAFSIRIEKNSVLYKTWLEKKAVDT